MSGERVVASKPAESTVSRASAFWSGAALASGIAMAFLVWRMPYAGSVPLHLAMGLLTARLVVEARQPFGRPITLTGLLFVLGLVGTFGLGLVALRRAERSLEEKIEAERARLESLRPSDDYADFYVFYADRVLARAGDRPARERLIHAIRHRLPGWDTALQCVYELRRDQLGDLEPPPDAPSSLSVLDGCFGIPEPWWFDRLSDLHEQLDEGRYWTLRAVWEERARDAVLAAFDRAFAERRATR